MAGLPLTAFDLVAVALVAISTALALVRGALRELLTIVAWVGAVLIAIAAFAPVHDIAAQTIQTSWAVDLVTLVVVFVVPLILLKVFSAMLADRFDALGLGRLDRLVGAVFGFARGALVVCAVYLGITLVTNPERRPAWVEQAWIQPYVEAGADWLRDLLPEDRDPSAAAERRTANR